MNLKSWTFKVAHVFGAAATAHIAFWLITHPSYEPNLAIRAFEIVGSIAAAVILCCDILNIGGEKAAQKTPAKAQRSRSQRGSERSTVK